LASQQLFETFDLFCLIAFKSCYLRADIGLFETGTQEKWETLLKCYSQEQLSKHSSSVLVVIVELIM